MTPNEESANLKAENAALRKQGQLLVVALETYFADQPLQPQFA